MLAVRGATKRFGAVVGLDGVDVEVSAGEVLALLGDNGAGKSTLIKCLSGALRLDRGTIEMDGAPVSIHSPADARALGIETVYQDLALFDNLRPERQLLRRPRARDARAGCRARSACSSGARWRRRPAARSSACRSTLDDHGAVGLMSGGQRQAVAVSRAAAFASRVVILDEPTAALGVRESRRVLDLILRLREERQGRVIVVSTRWTT